MSATLIRADTVLTFNGQDDVFRPGYIVIENGQISEVGARGTLNGRRFDDEITLDERLVMPGLVNAHTHTPMTLFRGLAEGHSLLTFDGWYNAIRVWEEVADADLVPPAVAVSCAEMIRTGTTCFADQYFYMDRIVPVVRQSGMRAALAYGIVEMGDEQARQRELAATTVFLEDVQDDPRITGWVGPHAFFVDNSPDAIRMELELATRFDTGLHIHLATSGEEDRYCRQHFGRSAVGQMQELGVLDRPVLAAHCITIPSEDFPTLADYPFSAVIAASAAMRSGADAAPLRALRDAGINTALGSDNVANNNTYDLFNEMQIAAKLMSFCEHKPGAVSAREILEMATMGGARALGLEEKIGSLEPGKQADLITLDLTAIGWGPAKGPDIYTALVYSVSGLHVRDAMVDGEWLLREGEWTTLDYADACAGLDAAHADLRQRLPT